MTVSDLYLAVSHLGFEANLDDDKSFGFYETLNKAVMEVNALRPRTSNYFINHRLLKNMASGASFIPLEVEDDIIFEAPCAKSYYFEADGNGTVYLETLDKDTNEWVIIKVIEFDAKGIFTAYKGFVKRDNSFIETSVRLRFVKKYLYSVRSVALYNNLYSEYEKDIPAFEPYVKYDISKLTDDFLHLSSPPIELEGYKALPGGDYDVENRRVILLPYNAPKGLYKVYYETKPKEFIDKGAAPDDQTVIELDEDLTRLLPNLCAAYLWAGDEPELAQYWLTLYSADASKIEYKFKDDHTRSSFRSVNGW